MRREIHNSTVRFRVNCALLAAAQEKALREGMTVSELLRHAIRKEVKDAA